MEFKKDKERFKIYFDKNIQTINYMEEENTKYTVIKNLVTLIVWTKN